MAERREEPGVLGGRKYSRRSFLKIGGAGLAGTALLGTAACGGGGGSFTGEITVGFGREVSGTLAKVIERFNGENQDITVRWRRMPSSTAQYFDQIRTEFQAQSGDLTLIGGDVIWPAQLAANGYIIDLSDRFTEEMRSRYLPGPIESNTYDGAVYGVPWFTDAGMLYYNREILEGAGLQPPTTWDELVEQAQQVLQDGGAKTGFVFQGSETEGGVCNGLEYINSFGGQVLNPDDASQVTIDSPESVAALATERSMITDGVAPQAVSTYDEPACEAPFLGGDALFCRNWPYMYALVGTGDFIGPEQVGIAPLPAGEGGRSVSMLGGWNFFINAFAVQEAQDAAWEFVKYMSTEERQKEFALDATLLPTLKSVYQDQEVLDNVPVIALGSEALANTEPRPVSPVYSDMSLEMSEQFNANLNDEVSPEEAIGTLQEQLQGIADQAPS